MPHHPNPDDSTLMRVAVHLAGVRLEPDVALEVIEVHFTPDEKSLYLMLARTRRAELARELYGPAWNQACPGHQTIALNTAAELICGEVSADAVDVPVCECNR